MALRKVLGMENLGPLLTLFAQVSLNSGLSVNGGNFDRLAANVAGDQP